MIRLQIHPERIYNMDETVVPLDPRPHKVVVLKGQKKLHYRYRIAGNFRMVQIFAFFADWSATAKIRTAKLLIYTCAYTHARVRPSEHEPSQAS